MRFDRSSGILLHPTSMPGPHGIGDLGPGAYAFVDWLAMAQQRLWQLLPLGPTGFGNSPYASPSAFAGNPLLISLEKLADDGLLTEEELHREIPFPAHEVDFAAVSYFKTQALWDAYRRSQADSGLVDDDDFTAFRTSQEHWLPDYALFMALKEEQSGGHWLGWPSALKRRESDALAEARGRLADLIGFHEFCQFIFRKQWAKLRRYANDREIRIIGDIPIYVAADSADVWANQQEFRLDDEGRPMVVTGVPPDYFSSDGQLWENPMFDWPRMAANGFSWWKQRVNGTLELVDIIRIDHFRGFAAGWVVPEGEPTARNGRWERGPGKALFDALDPRDGEERFIVEDLGLITPDVHELRQALNLPGMKLLHFAFDSGPGNQYLPHNYERNCAVYPGTHDNQTTVGWFAGLNDGLRRSVQTYLGSDGSDIAWELMRLALASPADIAITTLQDVMRLGDEAHMNRPGVATGNWGWRYLEHQLHDGLAQGLGELSSIYGRTRQNPREESYDPFDYSAPGSAHPLHEPGG